MTGQEIIAKMKELNLPEGSYIVFGATPLAVAGIRESQDIDLLVTPELRAMLLKQGWKEVQKGVNDHPVTRGVYEAHDAWNFDGFQPTLAELQSRALLVDGIPFASLQDVRKWKTAAGRPKDLADLALLDEYENQLKSTATLLPVVQEAIDTYHIEADVLPCDPELADTAAFCEHYGYTLEQAANTILVTSKKIEPAKYALCVVLGTTKLDVNKKVCELLGVKRASFADAETTIALTGMQIGGVTPFGVTTVPLYIDSRVLGQERVVMGGGNRSSKLVLSPKELFKLRGAEAVEDLAKEITA